MNKWGKGEENEAPAAVEAQAQAQVAAVVL
jgi:hypothetical protein